MDVGRNENGCMALPYQLDHATFGEDSFCNILDTVLDGGYRFLRFDESMDAISLERRRAFHLRHDVDISPAMALRLGEIEREHGAVGNFFFQINAETYSFFAHETLETIRDLRGMGHCVGLHIDELLIGSDERAIERTLDWVVDHVVAIDRAVSFHRPSAAVLGRRYAGFMNAYDERVFDADSYLSDSRRSLAFLASLTDWIAQGRPHIQLLLHPEWWREVSSIDQFWTLLKDRRTDQLRRYMLGNFPKVFAGVLSQNGGKHQI